MSDELFRLMERCARASGSPNDIGAMLVHRMRAGLLTQERLEIAAYVGDPGARAALGGQTLQHYACACRGENKTHGHYPVSAAPFNDWIVGFNRWEHSVRVRVALAAAETVVVHNEMLGIEPASWMTKAKIGLAVIEEWLRCPCDAHMNMWDHHWRGLGGVVAQMAGNYGHRFSWFPPVWEGHVWILSAARLVGEQRCREAISDQIGQWALSPMVRSSECL